jgi:hypothetical protein
MGGPDLTKFSTLLPGQAAFCRLPGSAGIQSGVAARGAAARSAAALQKKAANRPRLRGIPKGRQPPPALPGSKRHCRTPKKVSHGTTTTSPDCSMMFNSAFLPLMTSS